MIKVMDAVAADGNSSVYVWRGGKGTLVGAGTFGSGTLSVQVSLDNGTTWVGLASATMTAASAITFEVHRCQMRFNLAGATGPTLNAWVSWLPTDHTTGGLQVT